MRHYLNKSLLFILIGSFLLFISGCCSRPVIVQQGPDYSHEINQLRLIVEKLGIPESKASQMNLGELVTEIKIKMNDSVEYSGNYYSDEEFKRVMHFLYGEERLIEILNDYNKFIQSIKGKRIIVLPEE